MKFLKYHFSADHFSLRSYKKNRIKRHRKTVRDDSANGQEFPFRSQLTVPNGVPFVPNEDENAKYKKSLFLH